MCIRDRAYRRSDNKPCERKYDDDKNNKGHRAQKVYDNVYHLHEPAGKRQDAVFFAAYKNDAERKPDHKRKQRCDNGDIKCCLLYTSSGGELNRRMVESLIKAGAFDFSGVYRSRMVEALAPAIAALADRSRNNLDGQLDMFSMAAGSVQTVSYTHLDVYKRQLQTLR